MKIVKHSVKHGVATIVVQIPAAGRLTLHGTGLKTVQKSAPKAERVTLTTTLTRASAAALKKHKRHHRAMKVQLTASFAPTGAASSSASATLSFR